MMRLTVLVVLLGCLTLPRVATVVLGFQEGLTKEELKHEPQGNMRFLVLHPMHATSHVLTLRTLVRALVNKGHQVWAYLKLTSRNKLSPSMVSHYTISLMVLHHRPFCCLKRAFLLVTFKSSQISK